MNTNVLHLNVFRVFHSLLVHTAFPHPTGLKLHRTVSQSLLQGYIETSPGILNDDLETESVDADVRFVGCVGVVGLRFEACSSPECKAAEGGHYTSAGFTEGTRDT